MEDQFPHKNSVLYAFGPFCLDTGERRLLCSGKPVPLARKTFDLLQILVSTGGKLQSREALIEALWADRIVEEQGLTTKMHDLRKALGDEGAAPSYIETVRGIGYRFIAPVSVEPAPEQTAVAEPAQSAEQIPTGGRTARPLAVFGLAAVLIVVVAAALLWWFIPAREQTPGSSAGLRSMAVLPFENLSADPANAYFVEGIRDTILTRLAGLQKLRVISRTASDRYSSHPQNLSAIAKQLNVGTILEGSVQKVGKKVMINLQLIDAHSGTHLWAATYIRELKDIFSVETDVATKVAATLSQRLQPAEMARLTRPPTSNPEAYLLYLKANYYARRAFDFATAKNPAAAVSKADDLYRRAVQLDPDFALAWARLSLLESKAYWFAIDNGGQGSAPALEAAKKAVALVPGLPEAHVALGYAYYYGEKDFVAALEQFKLARASLPHNAQILGAMAYIHRRQGRWDKALRELHNAAALDPRNPRWLDETGITLMALRRYAEAIQSFNRALAIAPDDYDAKIRKANALLLFGKIEQTQKLLATLPRNADPQGFITSLKFDIAWLKRNPQAALAVLDAAKDWHPAQALRADALMMAGEGEAARAQYKKASKDLRARIGDRPDNPHLWSALGLAEAALGNSDAAIKAGKHAVQLYPISKDILAGPFFVFDLAKIHSRLHQASAAVKLLERLMSIPAGRIISQALLRGDPAWDPIRQDPRFQALLKTAGKHTTATTN